MNEWGEEAKALLKSIHGQHSTKKRLTLIALADATYAGKAQAAVFKNPSCASKVAHYKWLDNDPAYKAAYDYLVGSDVAPGVARARFMEDEEERETSALATIARARRKLRLLSGRAVDELEDLLNATITIHKDGEPILTIADSQVRLRAANSILDRNPETAVNSRADHTTGGDKLPQTVIYLPSNDRD
jgi:hypothetical protein